MLKLIACLVFAACTSSSVSPTSTVNDKCVQTINCIIGFHWDKHVCACVPDGTTP